MHGSLALNPGESALLRKPRLLLAEDEPATTEMLCEVLGADYEVEAVADGEAAWVAARCDPPDLILSDVLMPGLDGIELTRRLRAEPATATAPIILLTASSESETLVNGLAAGADDYLTKPFGALQLLARLRSHRKLIELRRQATLRQSDERYRLIVESARDYAIFSFDAQRRVTTWNAGAEAVTGFTAADILGQPMDCLFTPEDRERGVPARELAEARGTGRFDNERWHVRKDGSQFWGSGIVMPLQEDGPEPGCLKILRDLTSAHEAQEELTRALAAEQAARREAEEANRAKDRFLAALSHELRTPLAPVNIALYLMDRQKNLPGTVREGIETIRRCVDTEIQLIGDLLDVSRIVHGKLELDVKPMDLHDCIRHAVEVCRQDFDAREIELTVVLDAGQARVLGDAARLQQVFWNLLKNAAKFTPAKGRVHVESGSADGQISVAVADTGLGIAAEARAKIFDPFEQGDPDRARVYGGLGLGLAISHAIVTAHGGRLEVESPGVGQGTTFRVRLATLAD